MHHDSDRGLGETGSAAGTTNDFIARALDAGGGGRTLARGDFFGAYQILEFIAAGGMGEIYVAERLDDDGPRRKPIALKVLNAESAADDQLIRRLRYEAEFCSSVRSKHAIKIYEFNIEPERSIPYMAMEMLMGEELFERMQRHRLFPLEELADMAIDILRGLHDIHQAGIVHRDIKPENIFLAKDDEGLDLVKILDFGIARREGEPDPFGDMVGQVFGTPEYLAPEQSRSPDVTHLADIYSFGVVMYQCATGNLPFDEGTPYATMVAHQNSAIPPMPSVVDPEFCEIVYKAMAKNPDDRWQTAGQMAFALRKWLDAQHADGDFFGAGSLLDGPSFDPSGLGLSSDVLGQKAPTGPAYNSGRPRPTGANPAVMRPQTVRTGAIKKPLEPQSFVAPSPEAAREMAANRSLNDVRQQAEDEVFSSLLENNVNAVEINLSAFQQHASEVPATQAAASGAAPELELADVRPKPAPRPRPVVQPEARQRGRKQPHQTGKLLAIIALVFLLVALAAGAVMQHKRAAKPSPDDAPKASPVNPVSP